MRTSVCREFLLYLDRNGELDVGESPKAVVKWLKQSNLPFDLKHLLHFDWPQKTAEILPWLRLSAAKEIPALEARNKLLRHGFLQVGSSVGGDPLVIRWDLEPFEVGFLTHEEFWGQDVEPQKVYARIARSLESLLYRVVEDRYVPIDYYAAKDINAFLAEEARDASGKLQRRSGSRTSARGDKAK